jgi:hypothetical protein
MGESYRHALTDPDLSPFKRPTNQTKKYRWPAIYLARSCTYRRSGKNSGFDLDMESFQGIDKFPAIAVIDTLA